ncbi:MAG TPA: hypothetical protein VMD91_15160 [Candidatus Sulfotelmatobacter sp.]|nr:hypothetical protein [Candidatus Sulfotelmatobacter sp.]
MKPRDEMTVLAAEYLKNRDAVAERVGDAFQNIPRAPLAKLIDEFLKTSPKIDVAPILKKIADTNQGRLDDLNVPEFQSYLIAKCGTNEVQLKKLIQTLNNFHSFAMAKEGANKQVSIAARDEQNSGQTSATLNDLLKLRERRER